MRESVFVLLFLVFAVVDCGLRKHKPCVNGDQEGDKCYCHDGWTGAMCHRKMNCEGFGREESGSCVKCLEGWTGEDCDSIDCNGNGEANYDQTSCLCNKPFSGDHCEKFTTGDIYSYYNNIACKTGAFGVLTIIPLAVIYYVCDRFAKKRQAKRVEDQLAGTIFEKRKFMEGVIEEKQDRESLLAQQEDMTV